MGRHGAVGDCRGALGAGVANAGGWEPPQLPSVTCTQTNGDTIEEGDNTLPVLAALTGGGGDADSCAQQNNCGIGVEGNTNTAGDATGGEASGLLGGGGGGGGNN